MLDQNKTIGAVARELDLTPSALGIWVTRAQADRTKGRTSLTSEERAELAHLRKDNRELRLERDMHGAIANSRANPAAVGRSHLYPR